MSAWKAAIYRLVTGNESAGLAMNATFPMLVETIPSLTPADRDNVRLLAPGESMNHGDWTITREENR